MKNADFLEGVLFYIVNPMADEKHFLSESENVYDIFL